MFTTRWSAITLICTCLFPLCGASVSGQIPVFADAFESGSDCIWTLASQDSAQPLGVVATNGTTLGTGNGTAGTCLGEDANERIYAFTAPSSGYLSVSLQPLSGDDLGFYLRDACLAQSEFACVDDVGSGNPELAVVYIDSPRTIYVVVDGATGEAGPFALDLDFVNPICGNGVTEVGEECDDGDLTDTNGCTTLCQSGPICDPTNFIDGDRFVTAPGTGTCYVAFDAEQLTFASAASACGTIAGHLATITGAAEQSFLTALSVPSQSHWLGAVDDANDTDAVFAWITAEPFAFASWAPGEPDDDAGSGGDGECMATSGSGPTGSWMDTSCTFLGLITGYICEVPQL